MSKQLSLAGFDPAPPRNDTLFFAILPDVATARRIGGMAQGLRAAHGLRGKLIAPERLHITLHHLGDHAGLPTNLLETAQAVAATVVVPPFEVLFDRVISFGLSRNRPVVLVGGEALGGLHRFQQALGAAMVKGGLGQHAESHFTPHVTLLYNESEFPEQAVEPVGWTVREFVLVHSLRGKSIHRHLARWPLLAPLAD